MQIKLMSGVVQPELACDCSWSPGQVILLLCNAVLLRFLVSSCKELNDIKKAFVEDNLVCCASYLV